MTDSPCLPCVPCILLAAGGSARMGVNKLLLPLGGETVVRRAARVALEACGTVIVVIGNEPERIRDALAGLEGLAFAENKRWREGMAGSVKAGIWALPAGVQGFLVHHADMPFAGAEAFLPVIRAALGDMARRPRPILAAFRDEPGHPVYFPSSGIPDILALPDDARLKSLAMRDGILVETGFEAVLEDMDDPAEYERLRRKYGF